MPNVMRFKAIIGSTELDVQGKIRLDVKIKLPLHLSTLPQAAWRLKDTAEAVRVRRVEDLVGKAGGRHVVAILEAVEYHGRTLLRVVGLDKDPDWTTKGKRS